MRILLALLVLSTPAFADISIDDNHQTVTVDCAKDSTVLVNGNEATVTLTGTCEMVSVTGNNAKITGGSTKKVTLPGNNNVVALEGVDVIGTAGNKNTVTYKSTVNTKLKKPKIANPGNKNKISKTK
jgi:hypothetical protein